MLFHQIQSKVDLLEYFNIKEEQLRHILYYLPDNHKYSIFQVKKKNGTSRSISSPYIELKNLQTKLKEDLVTIFGDKSCVHGFVKKRNVLTNAQGHLNKKIVINLDLKDFFSTIHFGRVRGLFLSAPFNFSKEIATLLAQICCFKGLLPQGAPTSPIISNFICRKLDNDLIKFSSERKLHYSRYADDITFSSKKLFLPNSVGYYHNQKFRISDFLASIIKNNGFYLNEDKVRHAFNYHNQNVTGIKVNSKLNVDRKYIREIRAILNSCEKYGVKKSAYRHFELNEINAKRLKNPLEFFLKRLVGKISFIGFVRGKDDEIYRKLYNRVKAIVPNARLSIIYTKIQQIHNTTILTEGKTDWKHMKSAFSKFQSQGLYNNLNLTFADYLDEHKVSNSELFKICESIPKIGMRENKIICIFDRDDKNYIPKVTSSSGFYKDWTNNVFSMVLPIPKHRNFEGICIEHYYEDEDLFTYDHNNRRIFLSTEFEIGGMHKKESYIFSGKIEKLKNRFPTIIDSDVRDQNNSSVALSKNDFANYIYENKTRFDSFKIDAFKAIFDNILQIENINNPEINSIKA